MKVGVLGTGDVGRALGQAFVALGHEVKMGAREAGNETIELCASFGAGPAFRRVLVSRADSMETLVVLDARGLSGLLKVATEEPEGLLDDAIRKVGDEQLVERAISGRTIVEAAL